jgi:hypothetical protein
MVLSLLEQYSISAFRELTWRLTKTLYDSIENWLSSGIFVNADCPTDFAPE